MIYYAGHKACSTYRTYSTCDPNSTYSTYSTFEIQAWIEIRKVILMCKRDVYACTDVCTFIATGDKIEYCTLSRDKIEYLKNPKNTGSSTHKIEYSEIKNNQKIEYSGGHLYR